MRGPLFPTRPQAAGLDLFGMAHALSRQGKLADAERLFQTVIQQQPGNAVPHAARAEVLRRLERPADAIAGFRSAIRLDPRLAAAWAHLGELLLLRGDLDEALGVLTRATTLDPKRIASWFNLANAQRRLGRVGEAVESFGRALDLDPDLAIAHQNRAVCRMLLGDWSNDTGTGGFDEYAWRHRCPEPEARHYPQAVFDGSQDLSGRTLFIYPELFLGDAIQFGRYARLAEARGARVILAAPRALHALLSTLSPTVQVIDKEDEPPPFDLYAALMSLPAAFGVTPDDVKLAAPYLHADPARVAAWAERIGPQGFRIGVCWQGSTRAGADILGRSFRLADLAPIAALPGVRLISLQKHDGLDQAGDLPIETLNDFDQGPDAFLDTAAVAQACDLVITADTAVAHVAGAVGARTWLALPQTPDWRWLLDRADTPWYPATRLYRQASRGDWAPVFTRMAADLAEELQRA